jgi:hypothetical protein
MHLHTVYMEHSDCLTLPTLLNPLVAERTCFSQASTPIRPTTNATPRRVRRSQGTLTLMCTG